LKYDHSILALQTDETDGQLYRRPSLFSVINAG